MNEHQKLATLLLRLTGAGLAVVALLGPFVSHMQGFYFVLGIVLVVFSKHLGFLFGRGLG